MILKVRTDTNAFGGWALFDNIMELDFHRAIARYTDKKQQDMATFKVVDGQEERCSIQPTTWYFTDLDPDKKSKGFYVTMIRAGRGEQTVFFDTIGYIMSDRGETIETLNPRN